MDAIIIYWSNTGNTEKAALAIQEGLQEAGANVILKRREQSSDVAVQETILGLGTLCHATRNAKGHQRAG